MRWKIAALVLLTTLSGISFAGPENLAIKASTPVEVSIYPVTPVGRGQTSTFVVRAESSIPVENFVIKILPTSGSKVLAGELNWQGSMTPGVAQELRITLKMADDGVPAVSVNSGIEMGGDMRFAASATYRQQTQTPVGYQAVSKERKVKRKGRQVIEYKVN